MQNKFKKLLFSLALLPCFFILTACNGNPLDTNVNVNVDGNYSLSTYENLKENALDKINENYLDNTAYKITTKLNLSGTPTVNLNGIVKGSKLNNLEAAFKLISIGMRSECYVKDSVMYYLDSEKKIKSTIPSVEALKKQLGVTDIITLSDVFNKIEEAHINENIKVEKYTSNNETKFKVTFALIAGDIVYNYNVYFVFDNENLTGVKVTYTSSVYNRELTMEQFNNAIVFPDFSEFTNANIFNVNN